MFCQVESYLCINCCILFWELYRYLVGEVSSISIFGFPFYEKWVILREFSFYNSESLFDIPSITCCFRKRNYIRICAITFPRDIFHDFGIDSSIRNIYDLTGCLGELGIVQCYLFYCPFVYQSESHAYTYVFPNIKYPPKEYGETTKEIGHDILGGECEYRSSDSCTSEDTTSIDIELLEYLKKGDKPYSRYDKKSNNR